MKVVMYGTKACPDCVEAEEILKEKGIQYLYMEFSDNIGYLKRIIVAIHNTSPGLKLQYPIIVCKKSFKSRHCRC